MNCTEHGEGCRELECHIRQAVDAAPPLSAETRAELARLLGGAR